MNHDALPPGSATELEQLRQLICKLCGLLSYWLPQERPFQNQNADPICAQHAKAWDAARATIMAAIAAATKEQT
jgi:hypothetical protein